MTAPKPIPATVHDWCGQLDDPARDQPCPCRAYREGTARVAPRRLPTLAEVRASRAKDGCTCGKRGAA